MSRIVVFDSAQVPAQLITEADIDWAAEITEADALAEHERAEAECCGGRESKWNPGSWCGCRH
jgi:hypothetical protein